MRKGKGPKVGNDTPVPLKAALTLPVPAGHYGFGDL